MKTMRALSWAIVGMVCAVCSAEIWLSSFERRMDAEMASAAKVDLAADGNIFELLQKGDSAGVLLTLKNGDWIRMLVTDNPKREKERLLYALSSDGSRVKKRCRIGQLKTSSGALDPHIRSAVEESGSLLAFWRNPHLARIGLNMRDNFDAM